MTFEKKLNVVWIVICKKSICCYQGNCKFVELNFTDMFILVIIDFSHCSSKCMFIPSEHFSKKVNQISGK